MESRRLGNSGLKVPVLGFGTATFGGADELFRAWGSTEVSEARRMIDACLDAGACFFDTADSYSWGRAEEVLGAALDGRRDRALVATKVATPLGEGPNEGGSSRLHLIAAVEASLRRLRCDHVDVLYVHEFDGTTPVEETVRALDDLVTAGKVRYVGASNFSGWQLMKSLAVAERRGWARYVAHQVSYSLALRDYEWELGPLGAAEGVGAVVWSPLAGGALTGKLRRGAAPPTGSRMALSPGGPGVDPEAIHPIVDALDTVAADCGRTVGQVAINWLLSRATVSSVLIGARDERQLAENLAAADWQLEPGAIEHLDRVSERPLPYPYAHQALYPQLAAVDA
jgi:aryl-alcohol dehydrogenase-like predicted oxidoreductase